MQGAQSRFVSHFQPVATKITVRCSDLELPLVTAQSVRVALHRRTFEAADATGPEEWVLVALTEPRGVAETVEFVKEMGMLYEFHEQTPLRVTLCAAEGGPSMAGDVGDGMAALSLSDGEEVELGESSAAEQPLARASGRISSVVDEASPLAADHDLEEPLGQTLAQAHTTLADLLVCTGMELSLPLLSGSSRIGMATLSAKDASRARYRLQLQCRVRKLTAGGAFSRPGPASCRVFRKERGATTTSYVPVAETEAVNSADAIWKPLSMTVQELCGGNTAARCVKMQVASAGKEIAYCHVSVDDLLRKNSFPLKSASGRAAGTLCIVYYNLTEEASFLDCFQDGWELSTIMAIDYTASNGNPSTTTSLHHVEAGKLNEYEQTVKAVGEVLEKYTKRREVPLFGYGALRPNDHQVSHCFALSGNDKEANANGVEGVLEMYRESLDHVVLKGPTVFTHVIHRAIDIVHSALSARPSPRSLSSHKKKYYVLLIVTDGIIFDWKDTMDAIVEANALPLSIVIVGVGSPADFDKMSALYSENLKSSTGEGIRRKNVAFVPLRQYYEAVNVLGSFESIPASGTSPRRQDREVQHSAHYTKLAMPALSQLPQEMLEYLHMNNLTTQRTAPETDPLLPQSMNTKEPTGATEPPVWESDLETNQCRLCDAPFTFTNRKHHCRACGVVVCRECSANSRAIPQYSLHTPERCCDVCYAILLRGGLL